MRRDINIRVVSPNHDEDVAWVHRVMQLDDVLTPKQRRAVCEVRCWMQRRGFSGLPDLAASGGVVAMVWRVK